MLQSRTSASIALQAFTEAVFKILWIYSDAIILWNAGCQAIVSGACGLWTSIFDSAITDLCEHRHLPIKNSDYLYNSY